MVTKDCRGLGKSMRSLVCREPFNGTFGFKVGDEFLASHFLVDPILEYFYVETHILWTGCLELRTIHCYFLLFLLLWHRYWDCPSSGKVLGLESVCEWGWSLLRLLKFRQSGSWICLWDSFGIIPVNDVLGFRRDSISGPNLFQTQEDFFTPA